jgi:hypothetical protein
MNRIQILAASAAASWLYVAGIVCLVHRAL